MADAADANQPPATLAPPAVTALKGEAVGGAAQRAHMERSISADIRGEREDLREAAEQSLNVIMDLSLDGAVRWVSQSWQDIIGTKPEEVQGKNISELLVEDAEVFRHAVESMKEDDSRSHVIRFAMRLGPASTLRPKQKRKEEDVAAEGESIEQQQPEEKEVHTVDLEAQGIMVYDRTSGGESHTMWMIRPAVVREVTIDLPDILVESLGVGAEMLAHYLTQLAEVGATSPDDHPPPPPVLCRICERQITPWWFEKHTELCLQEHRAEMDVQLASEALTDHRNNIVKVLDALAAHTRQSRPTSAESPSPPVAAEYKGFQISNTSSPTSGQSSGRASPASPPTRAARSRERSASGFGHHRARSFAVRRPVSRIVELVLDLCDTALEINTPAIKETRAGDTVEFRTQSPTSESRISQVLQWQSPSTSALENEQGLALLCEDTHKLSRAKVEAVFRYRRILEYSERIRMEFDVLVQECIEAAIRKAQKIAAGELSDSSEDEAQPEDDVAQEEAELDPEPPEETEPDSAVSATPVESIFPSAFDAPSAMATALRNASDPALSPRLDRRTSSTAGSSRASSPAGAQTPRSYGGAMSVTSQNHRASMILEGDTGHDSDSSMRSSVMSGGHRAESPSGSEVGLHRVASSRERKRHSLILPSVMSNSRQQSPARGMIPPSSPLRMNKPRIPSGPDNIPSPITSPTLPANEFPSPNIAIRPQNHHRRQSSAAGSDSLNKPVSPRMVPVSAPQPRAVPPSIKDFEIIKPISKGAFGSVYLSKKKSTGDYFAIKVLKKADMVAKNQVTNVKAERAIMMWQGESDFVAKLYWTFASKDFLYLVMEYLNGGDCASLIKVLGALPEDWAKKYLAEVVLGVEHLHSRGIVHRDLKPDNLLIDQKGHLKLTDFGLSRMGLIGRQKRALNNKAEEPAPDLLKQGPFHRALSVASSRSTSFDMSGRADSPGATPSLTPALAGDIGQPSYFSLNREGSGSREPSRRTSGHRSDSAENRESDALQAMFRKFSIADEGNHRPARSPIEEEAYSEGEASPDPYVLQPTMSHTSAAATNTPPQASAMLPPPMALYDPEDSNRKFVGTPDYLAPETINGVGQDECSDWWSLGCIMFECLYGYPPFHAETPEQVFLNILERKIHWPEDDDLEVSEEAKDLMNRLMCSEPTKRLGANTEEKYASGGEEIRSHPWFEGIQWDTLRDDEASFVPALENPEDTEYFDSRGAVMQSFAAEFEDQGNSSTGTPGAEYPERPHDALSRVRTQVNSMKRGLMPLHIPPHVREGRARRLSEPLAPDDFGSFAFKNLPVLEKANKDVLQRLRAEAMQAQSRSGDKVQSPAVSSPTPSLESSPLLPMPLKRALSRSKGDNRPTSPAASHSNSSPSRASQPSSPLLVQFSAGQNHERRKTSSGSSHLSQQASSSLQPGSFFDVPKLPASLKTSQSASSPIKTVKTPTSAVQMGLEKLPPTQRHSSQSYPPQSSSPRSRSHTVGSQNSQVSQEDDVVGNLVPSHHKRRSQVLDVSPSSSDTEDSRQKKALLRVQRRRQSSRRLSQISLADGPIFRPLDVLVCEDHPVSRLVMEKLLEKLRCRTITANNGPEAMRYAMSEVKFDIIMMEFKLPQINGADVARMIRDTKNANNHTPIVAVTGYLKELQAPHHFDALIEKPPTLAKLTEVMGRLCQWRSPPANWAPSQLPSFPPSSLRQESTRLDDSPTSNSSSIPTMPSGSYRGSSREDSISSSFFGDTDSRSDDVPSIVSRVATDEWRDRDISRMIGGLGISEEPIAASEPKTIAQPTPIAPQPIAIPQPVTQHVPPPSLGGQPSNLHPHQSSAPAILEHPRIPGKLPAHTNNGKKKSLESKRQDSAEMGDDEDEELGDVQVRAKSPKHKPRPTSKLGFEMMRTNSRGSVISVEDMPTPGELASSPPGLSEEQALYTPPPPPSVAEACEALHGVSQQDHAQPPKSDFQVSITPPELFPMKPGDEVKEVKMETQTPPTAGSAADVVDPDPTPKANSADVLLDPDPTPKQHGSPLRKDSSADEATITPSWMNS